MTAGIRGTMVLGGAQLNANLALYGVNMKRKIADALRKAGGEVERVTTPKVPLETGELRSRIFNEGPLKRGNEHIQIVGFEKFAGSWDKNRAYAVPVHENLEARHPIGEALFLQKGTMEAAPTIARVMAQVLKEARI